MTLLVLIILAAIWAAVLVPPYLRNRSERPSDSISSFRQHLSTLERTRPGSRPITPMAPRPMTVQPIGVRSTGVPLRRSEVRKRRRDILFTLAGAVGVTSLLALVMGGIAILFALAAVCLLGGYCYLLVQLRHTEAERDAKVTYLPTQQAPADPALLLRRSASN